jgi:hypothetical protein
MLKWPCRAGSHGERGRRKTAIIEEENQVGRLAVLIYGSTKAL